MTSRYEPPRAENFSFYGMGTFNLGWSVGNATVAYGHVGDTYGYQSQSTFFPVGLTEAEGEFVLTVATNVETASQAARTRKGSTDGET